MCRHDRVTITSAVTGISRLSRLVYISYRSRFVLAFRLASSVHGEVSRVSTVASVNIQKKGGSGHKAKEQSTRVPLSPHWTEE